MINRKIKDSTAAIDAKKADIAKLRADAERCRNAVETASRSMDLLEQLRARKAEIQAMAFVEGTAAKTEDIDAEILGLEQGTAEMLAQARAARVALVMIEGHPHDAPRQAREQVTRAFTPPIASVSRLGLQANLVTHPGLVNRLLDSKPVADAPEPAPEPEQPKSKLGAALEELAALEEQRRQLALHWLEDRRERSLDSYMRLLTELGSVVAEMAAADKARAALGDHRPRKPGTVIQDEWREIELPIPTSRKTYDERDPMHPRWLTPITWPRDRELGNPELAALLAQLHDAGVLPLNAGDAATGTAAA